MQNLLQSVQYANGIYNSDIEPEHDTDFYCRCNIHQYKYRKINRLAVQEMWSKAVAYPGSSYLRNDKYFKTNFRKEKDSTMTAIRTVFSLAIHISFELFHHMATIPVVFTLYKNRSHSTTPNQFSKRYNSMLLSMQKLKHPLMLKNQRSTSGRSIG